MLSLPAAMACADRRLSCRPTLARRPRGPRHHTAARNRFVELALHAGDQVVSVLDETDHRGTLVLPGTRRGRAGRGGRPTVRHPAPAHHSRLESAPSDEPWRATPRVLTAADPDGAAHAADLRVWLLRGRSPAADGFYERLTERGFGYGPVFQDCVPPGGATVNCSPSGAPDSALDDAAAFGLHPALLDAPCTSASWRSRRARRALDPFSWSGVRLHATGAAVLRVRV
ncbi:hypothetical protein D3C59_37360, partial [Streptomyces sp. SHP22-7]